MLNLNNETKHHLFNRTTGWPIITSYDLDHAKKYIELLMNDECLHEAFEISFGNLYVSFGDSRHFDTKTLKFTTKSEASWEEWEDYDGDFEYEFVINNGKFYNAEWFSMGCEDGWPEEYTFECTSIDEVIGYIKIFLEESFVSNNSRIALD